MSRILLTSLLALVTSAAAQQKIQLKVYYETNCPFCQGFITSDLTQVMSNPQWAAVVDVDLIPYGMAQTAGTEVACQHGPSECVGNKIHNCAKSIMDHDAFVQFVLAFEKELKDQTGTPGAALVQKLAPAQASQIMACANGAQGNQLLLQAGEVTQAQNLPQVPYVALASVPGYNLYGQSLAQTLSSECAEKQLSCPQTARRLADSAPNAPITLV